MRKLYIIGNGFDIAHGVETYYWNFRLFLERKYPEFLQRFERLYGFAPLDDTEYGYSEEVQKRWDKMVNKELWSEFEKFMATPDIDSILAFSESVVGDMDLESGNIGIRDTMDDYWRSELGFIRKLQPYVKEWIEQIDLSGVTLRKNELVRNDSDYFFNFNYTRVLETVYKTGRVLHIHGSVEDGFDGDPIIGHCNRHEIDKRRQLSRDAESEFDEGGASIQDAVADLLDEIYKDTAFLIGVNEYFFRQLHSVNQIIIIGWSAGEVDIPYLQKIRNSVGRDTRWTVYYYAKDENDRKAYDSLWAAFEQCEIHGMFDVEFLESNNFWDY